MAVLYSNNFDAEANGALTGWALVAGAQLVVSNINDAGGTPVQGTKHYGQSSSSDSVRWEAGGSLTNQAVRIAQKYSANGSSIAAFLRVHATLGDRGVLMEYGASGGNLRGSVTVRDNGTISQAQSAYNIPVVVGDVVHLEARVVGNDYELRIWTNSNPRPSTATVSHTSTLWTAGRAGLRKSGAAFEFAACDQLVITDAAGGEDFFYQSLNFSGGHVLEDFSLTGSFQGVAAGAFLGSVGLDGLSLAGTFGASSGTLVSEPLRTNNGSLLALTELSYVSLYNPSTGALVVRKTSVTTDSNGVFTVTDPAIVGGNSYLVDWASVAGHKRMPTAVATI